MTRKQALEHIRVEFAENGKCTLKAMRIFCEHRISKKTFDEAAKAGIEIYSRMRMGSNER